MARDRVESGPQAIRALVSVAVVWLALADLPGAQQPEMSPIPPAITVTVQDPERPALTTRDHLLAAAAHIPAVLLWVGVAGVVVLSMWGVSCVIRMLPRRGLTHILFEDLSAGRDERLDRNRVLAQSVVSRLQNVQPLASFDLQMDIMPGANEAGFGGLQPVLTMASVMNLERTDRQIKIGAIEFSLRDLLTLISQWFVRPPQQYLEGWLIEANGSVEVGAQLLDHRRRPKCEPACTSGDDTTLPRPLSWVVRGCSQRDRAIADLAAQIVVDTGRSTLTSDWRSLRSFHEAMLLRHDQRLDAHPESGPPVDPKAILSAARGHLARSVSYDPSNWIARFSLAVTLCRDNEPVVALHHLAILKDAVARAWPFVCEETGQKARAVEAASATGILTSSRNSFDGPGFKELVRHLKTLPQCAFLILFNEGIALATQKDDIESLRKARAVFKQLSDWMPPAAGCATRAVAAVVPFAPPYEAIAPSVNNQSRTTLALYAMGAHASLIADTVEDTGQSPLEDHPVLVLEQLLGRIHADCRVQNAAHWPSALSARAITQAALGHVLLKRHCLGEAQAKFEEALAAEPQLVRALLGLAETYIRRADTQAHLHVGDRARAGEWLTSASALLARAMAINAGCAQGKRLSAELREVARRVSESEPCTRATHGDVASGTPRSIPSVVSSDNSLLL